MKMQTTAGQLVAGLRQFRGIIQKRNTIPVLGMVRFRGGRLTGTDLDRELSVALPTIGTMEGEAVVDYFGLAALAGCIDHDEDLTLTEAEHLATVAFNGSEYRMASCAAGDFPDFRTVEGVRTAADNLGLIAAMRRVRFAISTEETRYYLNGVALLSGPDGAIVVATDGHRLAMMPLDAMPEGAAGSIIPRDTVQWLCANRREPESILFDGDAGKDATAANARFDLPGGVTLSTKLIDGTYPDVFRVIPREPQPMLTMDRERLLRVLKRMREFGSGGGRGLKLSCDGEALTLHLVCPFNHRSAIEKLPVEQDKAKPFEAGFNIDYLISALSELRGEDVTFAPDRGEATGSPCLITSTDDALRIVQMPMRV